MNKMIKKILLASFVLTATVAPMQKIEASKGLSGALFLASTALTLFGFLKGGAMTEAMLELKRDHWMRNVYRGEATRGWLLMVICAPVAFFSGKDFFGSSAPIVVNDGIGSYNSKWPNLHV